MNTTTSNTTRYDSTIEADPDVPTVRIVRDFDASPDRVYRAWTDPELVVKWLGPNETTMRIDAREARTGGCYRYSAWRDGEEIARFYGSFHELRPNERLVQTFTYEGAPTASASKPSPSKISATAAPGSARYRSSTTWKTVTR